MNDFVEQFLNEARELVEQAVADLLALEKRPDDAARLESAFRAFHTLKGAAGIMEYGAMERLLHGSEDTLQALRSASGRVTPRVITDSLAGIDLVSRWLDVVQATGDMPPTADDDLGQLLAQLGSQPPAQAPQAAAPAKDLSAAARAILEEQLALLDMQGEPESLAGRIGSAGRAAANVSRLMGRDGDARAVEEAVAASLAAQTTEPLVSAIRKAAGPTEGAAPSGAEAPAEEAVTTIRVEVARIDALVDLAGELLIAKNALGHWARRASEGEDVAVIATGLKAQHATLDRQIAQLQSAAVALRVLPLSRVFGRFPRLVRDTAERLGKMVELTIEGGATEADKAVVENLFEPLLHVVRNAVDHGVETPGQRRLAGKPEASSIALRGWRDGDHVVIEVADDGAGVDPDAIRRVAGARGLGAAEDLARLADDEAVELIFAPGFSTASSVTELSGRGVGMGAVRSAVERLGGAVGMENRRGQGLTVRFTLPFTIMMTRVMTVEAGGQTFGLPFDAVIETVRIPRSQIRPLGGGRVFVLRDRTIPVINLAETLQMVAHGGPATDDVCIVIAWADGEPAGVEIDRPGERVDMMLKPMEGVLAGMRGVAGASLLGDGRVLIVLDVSALFR